MGFVSEDGVPYGSLDVNDLDNIEPKSDEAKAVVDALKADIQQGQDQANSDAEKLAEQSRVNNPTAGEPAPDSRDAQGKPTAQPQQSEQDKQAAAKKSASSSHDKG